MHSFVRKHQQYALMGGLGRKGMWLYDTADLVSIAWAKMSVEQPKFVSLSDVKQAQGKTPF